MLLSGIYAVSVCSLYTILAYMSIEKCHFGKNFLYRCGIMFSGVKQVRLKELRKERKILQRQVAEAINCSQAVYSRYESGEREPSKEILAALADFYGVSVDYLLGRDDPVIVTGNPGSGKSSLLTGDWYPSAPPQPPLVLDGGPPRGIIEDRPETQAIINSILAKLAQLDEEGQKEADTFIDFILAKQNGGE
jgi:transcriptional regulator with XRE-family HTH domain